MSTAWTVRDLSVRYPDLVAVDGVSLEVHPGERLGLVGTSGSGKTSLVRAGLGLIPRSGGSVELFGESVDGWGAADWERARSRAQLLFQDPRAMLHPALPLELLLRDTAEVHEGHGEIAHRVQKALAKVGLADRGDALPHQLSGGERRRAGVARVLLTRPELLVADEPTVGLDAALKADLIQLLLDRVSMRCAVVLVSHDLSMVTWACTRIAVMDRGKLVEVLPTSDLGGATHPASRALIEAAGLLEST